MIKIGLIIVLVIAGLALSCFGVFILSVSDVIPGLYGLGLVGFACFLGIVALLVQNANINQDK